MTEKDAKPVAPQPLRVTQKEDPRFVHKVVLVYTIGMLFFLLIALLWFAAEVLLLVFASILIAVLLTSASAVLKRYLHLSHGLALATVLVVALVVFGGGGWLLAPRIMEQGGQLMTSIPDAMQQLRDYVSKYSLLERLMEAVPPFTEIMQRVPAILNRAGTIFSSVLGMLANFLIVFFVSIYLAAQPHTYVGGIVTLLPKHTRKRAREVLYRIGDALGLWLLGKMMSMVIVGPITAIGLSLLGVPLALVLGVVAGFFEFIPYLGPILAGVPAVLIAFSNGPILALQVLALFGAIQLAEGYLLQPLVERRTVSLPPAMTISMQVLLALPFGLFGIALATPLTAAIVVAITMLYVQDVLDDQVQPPGRDNG